MCYYCLLFFIIIICLSLSHFELWGGGNYMNGIIMNNKPVFPFYTLFLYKKCYVCFLSINIFLTVQKKRCVPFFEQFFFWQLTHDFPILPFLFFHVCDPVIPRLNMRHTKILIMVFKQF